MEYKRPKKTFQETLSADEIKKQLEHFKKVSNPALIPINAFVKYFAHDNDGNKKFRIGGVVKKNNTDNKYLILQSSKASWSVQYNNNTFFVKLSDNELKTEFKDELKHYKKKIQKLEDIIHKYEKENKQLKLALRQIEERRKIELKLKK